ncbi:hypothetical protein ElyMa_002455500 [Elysia marginata]|uniref:Uncharacterized protein n=1 Tax=Elysia marginata TaxID=1093978 RepID=A0AAV4GN05_9GAST|nr:hypothetical protein ElyMa_002455500 [Elysia marginata]
MRMMMMMIMMIMTMMVMMIVNGDVDVDDDSDDDDDDNDDDDAIGCGDVDDDDNDDNKLISSIIIIIVKHRGVAEEDVVNPSVPLLRTHLQSSTGTISNSRMYLAFLSRPDIFTLKDGNIRLLEKRRKKEKLNKNKYK